MQQEMQEQRVKEQEQEGTRQSTEPHSTLPEPKCNEFPLYIVGPNYS